MAKMKDSGIEWIGEIPEDWKITRCKYLMSFQNGYAFDSKDLVNEIGESVIRIGDIQNGSINFEDSLNYTKKITSDMEPYKIKDTDILIAMSGATVGKIGFYDSSKFNGKTGYINQRVGIIRSNFNKFIFYYLSTSKFIEYILLNSLGSAQPNVSSDMVLNYTVSLPPLETQKRIADFLDAKCAKIDSLKNDIQKQIETLEQYKKSVITEAVTGKLKFAGINPNAKMKNSGVSWINEIPEGWNCISSKYLFSNSDSRKKKNDIQLTASQEFGVISQRDYMNLTGNKIVLANYGLENWKHVDPNNFIISLRSFQGGLEMSEISGCITWHYIVLKPLKKIVPKYYKWLFKSSLYIKALQSTCNYIRDGQDLRYSNFIQVPLFDVPLTEQQIIADYLDSKCSSIDNIITTKKQQLEKLDEYKKSLIFEYVTGKKQVV